MQRHIKQIILLCALVVVGLLAACGTEAKQSRLPPAQPSVEYRTEQSILAVERIEGAEYRLNNGEWTEQNEFEVQRFKSYFVEVRYRETANHLASDSIIFMYYTAGLAGAGNEQNPYLIASPSDLDAVRYVGGKVYRLTCNIDFEGEEFVPIGAQGSPFSGTLYGGGYQISNLRIADTAGAVGIFSALYGASVQNLTLDNVSYEGGAGIAGILAGVVDDSEIRQITFKSASLVLSGAQYAGIVAGMLGGVCSVEDIVFEKSSALVSVFDVSIDIETDHQSTLYVGAVAGRALGAINYPMQTYSGLEVKTRLSVLHGGYLFAGGAFGKMDHIRVADSGFTAWIDAKALGAEVGVGAGSMQGGDFSDSYFLCESATIAADELVQYGGVAGYAARGAVITACEGWHRAKLTSLFDPSISNSQDGIAAGGIVGNGYAKIDGFYGGEIALSATSGEGQISLGGIVGRGEQVEAEAVELKVKLSADNLGGDTVVGGAVGSAKNAVLNGIIIGGTISAKGYYSQVQATTLAGVVGVLSGEDASLSLRSVLTVTSISNQGTQATVGGVVGSAAGQLELDCAYYDKTVCDVQAIGSAAGYLELGKTTQQLKSPPLDGFDGEDFIHQENSYPSLKR